MALGSIPSDPSTQRFFYSAGIGLLYDLALAGVLIVDSGNCISSELFTAVDKWPVKYRKRAKELLTKLRVTNRIVKTADGYELAGTCPIESCKHGVAIAKNHAATAIAYGPCMACAGDQVPGSYLVDLAEYPLSTVFRESRLGRTLILGNGQWTQLEFEQKVLIPVFTYAKHVKIYDRHIGRSIWTRDAGGMPLKESTVSPNYRITLEWIFKLFLATSPVKLSRVFEVCCGLDVRFMTALEIQVALKALKHFEEQMQKLTGFPFHIIVKRETRQDTLPHARYLITDQVALLIERGFDLLWSDEQMTRHGLPPSSQPRRIRDVVVASCPDHPGQIEKAVRALPDLELPG
jgi:hypothetical protein